MKMLKFKMNTPLVQSWLRPRHSNNTFEVRTLTPPPSRDLLPYSRSITLHSITFQPCLFVSRCEGFLGTNLCPPRLSCMVDLGLGRHRDHEARATLSSHVVQDPHRYVATLRESRHPFRLDEFVFQPQHRMHARNTSLLPLNREHVKTRFEEDINPQTHNETFLGTKQQVITCLTERMP